MSYCRIAGVAQPDASIWDDWPLTDVAFIDEVYAQGESGSLDQAFKLIWERRQAKSQVQGIHGTLFYELEHKKAYYPDRKDEGAVNPNGSRLR